ncbi:MAG: hypothetical protein FJ098_15255, partial [Deltaproteobacteria bacterium]|nr:hypothetical protein [Deltaproteobacteria bacterium]
MTGRVLRCFAMALLIATLAACGDAGGGGGTDEDTGGACPIGADGCPCFGNGTCLEGIACVEGICAAEAPCPEGTAGCPCFGNGTCMESLTCAGGKCLDETACPAGTEDCPCEAGSGCDAGLTCLDNLCRDDGSGCVAGTEGCPCGGGNACGVSSLGEVLACVDGVCSAPSCPAGQTGCPCLNLQTCASEEDECNAGFCQPAGCIPGTLGCACAGGACQPGLTCRDGVLCVEAAGLLGGPCYDDGTCAPGFRCSEGTCVPCTPGSQDCMCKAGDVCQPGLVCWKELCRDEEALGDLPPGTPQCYTPCTADFVSDDGTFVACSTEGLMPGCYGGFECEDGSCLAPGGTVPVCALETDCPSFQTCLFGSCYSNCEADADCDAGRICHKHVCRDVCDASLDECPEGTSCVTVDGVSGVCLAVADPAGTPQTKVQGEFVLSTGAVEFSNVKTSATLTITNLGPTFEQFTVRKRSHTAWMEDGGVQQYDDPWGDD